MRVTRGRGEAEVRIFAFKPSRTQLAHGQVKAETLIIAFNPSLNQLTCVGSWESVLHIHDQKIESLEKL